MAPWGPQRQRRRVPGRDRHPRRHRRGRIVEQGVGVDRLAGGVVQQGRGAVDLRGVQVVDGRGVGAVRDLVGRVLVGEGRVQAGLVSDVEDRVRLQKLVGVDDLVGGGVDG